MDRIDSMVTLEVADNGPGIDPRLRTRIFEPYFSTKKAAPDSDSRSFPRSSPTITALSGSPRTGRVEVDSYWNFRLKCNIREGNRLMRPTAPNRGALSGEIST